MADSNGELDLSSEESYPLDLDALNNSIVLREETEGSVVVTDPPVVDPEVSPRAFLPIPSFIPINVIASREVSPRAEDYQPSAPPLHALPHPTAQECLRHLDSLAAIPHYIYIHNQPSAPPLQDLPHPTAQECLRRLDALELEIAWLRELMSRRE